MVEKAFVSDTYMTAVVPAQLASGYVMVTTAASSNLHFLSLIAAVVRSTAKCDRLLPLPDLIFIREYMHPAIGCLEVVA